MSESRSNATRPTADHAPISAARRVPPLVVEVAAKTWVLVPDGMSRFSLTVRNPARTDAACTVRLDGPAAAWLSLATPSFGLPPGGQATLLLIGSLPKQPAPAAGTYPLVITVATESNPSNVTACEVGVRVPPLYEFRLGPPAPARQTLRGGRSSAQVWLPLTNRSNSEVTFVVEGSAASGPCRFEFLLPDEPPLVERATLRLGPGDHLDLPVRITLPARPWVGWGRTGHPFSLAVTMEAAQRPRRSVGGLLVSAPVVGPLPLTGLALGLLVLLALVAPHLLAAVAAPPPVAAPSEEAAPPLALLGDLESGALEAWLATRVPLLPSPTPAPTEPAAPPADEATAVPASGQAVAMTYEAMFQRLGAEYGLDWRLLAGIAFKESGINPRALGRDQDMGLMQIIPSTWNQIAPRVGATEPYDAYSNARVAAVFLAYLRDTFAEMGYRDERYVLVAYNWGPNNVLLALRDWGGWQSIPPARQAYALDVLRYARSERPPAMEEKLQEVVPR